MAGLAIPKLIAHRGYALRYPENSLPGLKAAVEAGARYLEFDVQLCRDGVPVLLHDADLMRTAGRPDDIWTLAWSELHRIFVGEPERFGSRFCDVRLPSLAAVVDWWRTQPDVTAFVELKEESLQHFGVEVMLEAVRTVLAPVAERAVLLSYDSALVAAVRERGDLRTGWVVGSWNPASERMARNLAPDFLFCNWKRLPQEDQPLWEGPWQWAIYEVREARQALALAARGVGFIETMAVGEVVQDLLRVVQTPPEPL